MIAITKIQPVLAGGLRAVLYLVFSLTSCYGADLVFVYSSQSPEAPNRRIEIAAQFYGLNLKTVVAPTQSNNSALDALIRSPETRAVVVEASALPFLNSEVFLRSLARTNRTALPLLILGITPQTNTTLLRTWSANAVESCNLFPQDAARYSFGSVKEFTRQLAGLETSVRSPGHFVLTEGSSAHSIIDVQKESLHLPSFIVTPLGDVKLFMHCSADTRGENVSEWSADHMVKAFIDIAPAMLFVRYSAGEWGWHPLNHYANFTIDDPWLRESYGHLRYSTLLEAMEEHNFHTTIALIPWNYNRSDPKVVSIIRKNSDRYSISIHGDNHDHQEFTDFRVKPLSVQIDAMKQALARMEQFRALTGIPFDKVMIFPHNIAPQRTIEALKTYNYLATINSSNVPMDGSVSDLLPFALRPATDRFGDFASVRRYEVPVSRDFIQVNQFLGNPLFLYTHQDFFEGGINAFNTIADQVNSSEPDTRWRSLGEMVRHLYLVKLRSDANYDVRAFTDSFCLDNPLAHDTIFFVHKRMPAHPGIATIHVDGRPWPHQIRSDEMLLEIPVAAGHNRTVEIMYENDLNLATVPVAKDSVRVFLLRTSSDFRDLVLSQYSAGRFIIKGWYSGGWIRYALAAPVVFFVLVLMRRIMKRRAS